MLKKVKLISGIMVIALAATWLIGSQLSADSATPGTVNDPIVTRSYVDMKVGELQTLLTNMIGTSGSSSQTPTTSPEAAMTEAEMKAYIDQQMTLRLAAELSGLSNQSTSDTAPVISESTPMLFEVIEAVQGQQLICGASAEIILRAGSATVIAGSGGDGLADLTSGDDLQAGAIVPKQHHLLVSRDDGRGLLITSDATSYILVKGDYTLE